MSCCGGSGVSPRMIGGYLNGQGVIYQVREGVPVKTVLYVGKVFGKRNFEVTFATYPFGGSKSSRMATMEAEHADLLVSQHAGEFIILDTDKLRNVDTVDRLSKQLRVSKDVPLEAKERKALIKANLWTVGSILACGDGDLAKFTKLSRKACKEMQQRIRVYIGIEEEMGEEEELKRDDEKQVASDAGHADMD